MENHQKVNKGIVVKTAEGQAEITHLRVIAKSEKKKYLRHIKNDQVCEASQEHLEYHEILCLSG